MRAHARFAAVVDRADIAGVTDLDGALLGLLMGLRKQARATGRRLRIEGGSGLIQRLFRLNAAAYLLE
jgi:anti-anti-sigma regulatory factor